MWSKSKPLKLPPHGSHLSEATDEEYLAVAEDLSRWQQARKWRDSIVAGRTKKAAVWAGLLEEPEAYREDMLRRLKHYFAGGAQ